MPYDDERPNLLGHRGLVSDEDIQARLRSLDVGPSADVPSEDKFGEVNISEIEDSSAPPEQVVAVDGSQSENPIDAERINAQVGFIEVAVVTVDTALLRAHRNSGNRFVPPTIEDDSVDAEYVRIVLPSQNAYFNNESPKPVGFRRMLYENFRDKTVGGRSLLSFLSELFNHSGNLNKNNTITLKNCPYRDMDEEPDCKLKHQVPVDGIGECSNAQKPLFPTDKLRIHEYVTNRFSNISAINLVMKTVEHLALGLAIDNSVNTTDSSPNLSEMAFMKDGPLAQFDRAAWLSSGMSDYLYNLRSDGHTPIVIGIDKSGEFARFAEQLRTRTDSNGDKILEPNSVVSLSSEFIYDHIKPRSSETLFGKQTYYGKSFLYKSPSDYMFCLTIAPRSFDDGATNGVDADGNHSNLKHEPSEYPTLGPAIAALHDAEYSLLEDSVIPIHMAHERATIPRQVGDKVLSELVDRELVDADRIYGK
jgi:hypothetical protein